MFSGTTILFRKTLAFRLTLWYGAVFALSTVIAFSLFYLLITAVLERQTDQELHGQIGKFSALLSLEGADSVKALAMAESQAGGVKKVFFRFLTARGDVFSSSSMSYWQDIGVDEQALRQVLRDKRPVFSTVHLPGRADRVRVLYGFIGPGVILQVGQSMEVLTRFLTVFQKIFILTAGLLLLIAAGMGWFMARKALSGVETVTRTARLISRDDLKKRVPVEGGGDEIEQLARTFNDMLDEIEKLVTGMREMSDSIAHDLKSPVTAIRGLAEVTLTTAKSPEEYGTMAASIIEECDRLLDMVNTMLLISRMESGVDRKESAPMDLAAVVREACDLFQPLAEDREIGLACAVPGSVPFSGDLRQIQRMVANLIDNAIKYTPSPGAVAVTLHREGPDRVNLAVEDTGVGISGEDLPHVFDRFYRCDHSRSREGAGLGLSLARAVARAHGGDISVTSTPGKGSTFTVDLPSTLPFCNPAVIVR